MGRQEGFHWFHQLGNWSKMGDVREYSLVWLYEDMMSKRLIWKIERASHCFGGVRGSLKLLNASCSLEELIIRYKVLLGVSKSCQGHDGYHGDGAVTRNWSCHALSDNFSDSRVDPMTNIHHRSTNQP